MTTLGNAALLAYLLDARQHVVIASGAARFQARSLQLGWFAFALPATNSTSTTSLPAGVAPATH